MPKRKTATPRRSSRRKAAAPSRFSAEYVLQTDFDFINAEQQVAAIDYAPFSRSSVDAFPGRDDDDDDEDEDDHDGLHYLLNTSTETVDTDEEVEDEDADDEQAAAEAAQAENDADAEEIIDALDGADDVVDLKLLKKSFRKSRTLPSVPDLYGMPRAICGQKLSSEQGTKCMFAWHCYMSEREGRTPYVDYRNSDGEKKPQTELFGLSLYRPEAFTNSQHDEKAYDTLFLGRAFGVLAKYCTYQMLKKSVVFYNAHMKAEHYNRMLAAGHPSPRLSDPQVGKNQTVKQQMLACNEQRASRAMDNCEDLFTAVDSYISDDEDRRIMEGVLSPIVGGKIQTMHPLNRLNLAASYTASRQDVRRGDEHYQQFRVQRFVQRLRNLGPYGTDVLFFMSRKAKHNKYGRIELMAYGPHLDPLLDATAWHGAQLLYRLFCQQETLIFFNEDGSFDYTRQYKVPTYKSVEGGANRRTDRRISKDVYRSNWQNAFLDAGVKVKKIITQWRLQAYMEMDMAGLSDSQMARMAGHRSAGKDQTAAQAQNYQTNVTVHGVAQRCGVTNPRHPERLQVSRYEAWTVASEFAHYLCRDNLAKWSLAMDQLHSACRSHKERVRKRLITGKHCVDCMIFEVTAFCLMIASRPVMPVTFELCIEEPCYFERHKLSPTLRDVLSLPEFQTQKWQDVLAAVRAAEDTANTCNIDPLIQKPVKNCLDVMENNIVTHVKHAATMQVNASQQMALQVGVAVREIQDLRDALANANVVASMPGACRSGFRADPPLAPKLPPATTSAIVVPVVRSCPSAERKKRPAVTQEQVQQADIRTAGGYRPVLLHRDSEHTDFMGWWNFWKWIQKTDAEQGSTQWRSDAQIAVRDETTQELTVETNHNNTQWLSKRRCIWEVPQYLIEHREFSEEEAIEVGKQLYAEAKGDTNKPSLKKLKSVFSAKAKELGIYSRGRRKGSTDAHSRKRSRLVAAQYSQLVTPSASRFMEMTGGDVTEREMANLGVDFHPELPNEYAEEDAIDLEYAKQQRDKSLAHQHGGLYLHETGVHVRVPPPNAPPGWTVPVDHNLPPNNRILAASLQPGGVPPPAPQRAPLPPPTTWNQNQLYSNQGERSRQFAVAREQQKIDEQEKQQRLASGSRPPPTGITFGPGTLVLPARGHVDP